MSVHTHHLPSHTHANNLDHSETNEVELKEGEIICNKCNGSGYDPETNETYFYRPICPKCQGEKKLDWISAATGVAPKEGINGSSFWGTAPNHTHSHIHGTSGFNGTSGHTGYFGNISSSKIVISDEKYLEIENKPIKEYVSEIAAKEIAKKIDEEVVKYIEGNFKKQKEQILNTKRRKFFDNRIFSKLMFYCNFKQRFKSKKDKNII